MRPAEHAGSTVTLLDPALVDGRPGCHVYTLSSFERRLIHDDRETDVELEAGRTAWLDAQDHSGENIGSTATHVLFVELMEPAPPSGNGETTTELGPSPGT